MQKTKPAAKAKSVFKSFCPKGNLTANVTCLPKLRSRPDAPSASTNTTAIQKPTISSPVRHSIMTTAVRSSFPPVPQPIARMVNSTVLPMQPKTATLSSWRSSSKNKQKTKRMPHPQRCGIFLAVYCLFFSTKCSYVRLRPSSRGTTGFQPRPRFALALDSMDL